MRALKCILLQNDLLQANCLDCPNEPIRSNESDIPLQGKAPCFLVLERLQDGGREKMNQTTFKRLSLYFVQLFNVFVFS